MLRLLAATVLTAAVSVSCSEISFLEINPPADLQEKIDAIQAEKDAQNALLGDKKPVDITVPIVGAEDCSSGWWSAFSEYFAVPTGKLLSIEFINHGTGVNNWNNWNLCVTNPKERDTDGYAEYFLLRSDAYGWGNADYAGTLISMDYQDINGDGDIWDDFRANMQGATVVMEIDHSTGGYVFVTATATSADGSVVMTQTYNHPVSKTEDIWAFLVCDGSWFEMKSAWLEPSKIQEIPDEMAASISVAGTPAAIEIGSEDFWGAGVATVTYTDGTTAQVDTADITFVVPDLSTVGPKTVIYSYSKTKQGNYGPAVAGVYSLEVVNPVVAIEVTAAPTYPKYYVYDAAVKFDPTGLVVTATYADETTGVLANSMLTFGEVPADGTQEVEISYVGSSSTVTTTCPVEVVKGTAAIGVPDCSTGWWTAFTADVPVPAGESVTYNVYQYSNSASNWSCTDVILRKADLVENAVLRMDHFGWGTGYDNNPGLVAESNWNWDTFQAGLNRATIKITVTNNGDNTADVYFDVTYINGEAHFQNYKGIVVDSADLQFCLTCEGAYTVIY